MKAPFAVTRNGDGSALLKLDGSDHELPLRDFTPWIPVEFRAGLGMKIRGQVQFYLKEIEPHFKLYMSPINIAPDRPSLPISNPVTYSMYLAKTQGSFNTLGLSEDTWALNERVLDEEAFLKQAWSVHEERERMFFDAVAKTRQGAVVCVFDITDRLQHMFWRYLEPDHPANAGKDVRRHADAIRNLYQRMDDLVGRLLDKVDDETAVFVMSDHGFNAFRRGVNLNSWLHQSGYLTTKAAPTGREWFAEVDWSRTRAYAVGLGGIYLNLKGRESDGIVEPGAEAAALKKEIQTELRDLRDPKDKQAAVGNVYDTGEAYHGPYVQEGPDLIVGFNHGYRVSWSCATAAVTPEVFEDNTKSWSGDHCMNPPDMPGILFSNREIKEPNPSIMDLGPTVLDLFGVPAPAYCDGKSLMPPKS